MQCAWMTSRHRENDHYWCVVGVQAVGINYYKLWKTCHHAQYHDKDASDASRDYGAVYQASTPPSAGVDTFEQPPSQNQGYRTARR